jgi:hypothetical protein
VSHAANAGLFLAHTRAREIACEFMLQHIESGGRVIVGTLEPMHIGSPIGQAVRGKFLVVKCQSTREEFLVNKPGSVPDGETMTTPFYWEIEVRD